MTYEGGGSTFLSNGEFSYIIMSQNWFQEYGLIYGVKFSNLSACLALAFYSI